MRAWKEEECGVFSLTWGRPRAAGMPRALPPRSAALKERGGRACPAVGQEISFRRCNGGVLVRLPLEEDEHIYGLGIQYFRQDQRGKTRYLRVNSDPCADNGESNAPLPFYVSTRGYALLVDTARIVTVWCGSSARLDEKERLGEKCSADPDFSYTAPSCSIELFVRDGGVKLFLFAGKDMMECVCRYNLYSGGGVLPPLWALGFWHRVGSRATQEEVLREAEQFSLRGYPCDVFGLEPGWQSNSYPCSLEWSKERFPDPAKLCADLKGQGIRVNTWQHLYLSRKNRYYRGILPFCGDHTVWGGAVPDLETEGARRILRRTWSENQAETGVSGMKLDECDGSELTKFSWIFPPHAAFPSGEDGETYRQKMGTLYQRETASLYRERGVRTFGLARASGAYAAPLPYGIYSDLYDHRQYLRALVNAGYCGMLWVPEVRSAESGEDWLRRFQTAVFSPVAMLNGWYDRLAPWSFAGTEESVRALLELRMRLVPYLYTAFYEYAAKGVPVCRPMNLQFGPFTPAQREEYRRACNFQKVHPWDTFEAETDGQFMLGEALLVAPLVAGEEEKTVFLPQGMWYDFFTGEKYGGGFLTKKYAASQIPVFVREGSVIPLALPAANTDGLCEVSAEVFGNGHAEGILYDDDGESFAFEEGEYCLRTLSTDGPGREQVFAQGKRPPRFQIKKWNYRTVEK